MLSLQAVQVRCVEGDLLDHLASDDLGRAGRALETTWLAARIGRRLTDELLGLGVDLLDAIRALNDPIDLILRRSEQIAHPGEVFLRLIIRLSCYIYYLLTGLRRRLDNLLTKVKMPRSWLHLLVRRLLLMHEVLLWHHAILILLRLKRRSRRTIGRSRNLLMHLLI